MKHQPAGDHAPGTMREIYDFTSGVFMGCVYLPALCIALHVVQSSLQTVYERHMHQNAYALHTTCKYKPLTLGTRMATCLILPLTLTQSQSQPFLLF